MNRLLIENGTVVTLGNPNRILVGHAVLIEGCLIKALLPQRLARHIRARRIDAEGKVVMPGFINAHMHFYSSFARGLTPVAPAGNFLEMLRHLWWRLDRRLTLEDCYVSALVAGLESIRHGTTTVFDHHASPHALKGSLRRIAQAVNDLGLRACLCYEVSDRDGRQVAQAGIEENMEFIESCGRHPNSRLRALFGLHASFTLGARTLRRCAESGAKCQAGFHIHCAEDAADQAITKKRFGERVVRRLEDHGILGPHSLCIHGVHLQAHEWDILARTRTPVVHNPQSNLNNAVGVMDLLRALKQGVLVGLGTDAMTSNMLEELRSAIWAQKWRHRNPSVAFHEAVGLLVRNNQEIANRHFCNVGQLREGWTADLICVDYMPPTEMNVANFPGHLVFGLSQAAVDTTIVDGNVLMKGRKFTSLIEDRIADQGRRLSRALWQRF
jgi:putative selenium metabolism protein SsnA